MPAPIRIVGSGPSGLTAAIVLARAGRAVEVFERAKVCGARFGGDLQGLENWSNATDVLDEFRALGLGTAFRHHAVSRAIHTNGARDITVGFRHPIFYLVKRGTDPDALDRALERQALAAGVTIRFGETIDRREADIVATGPDPRGVFAVDSGIVFETDTPDTAIVLTNERASVRGYSYLLIAGGYGCLCTVLFAEFHLARERFDEARATFEARYAVRITNPRPVGGYGHYSAEPVFQRGRALYVGEAAGLQDLLWGFGIRTAVGSGALAARCMLDGRDYPSAAHEQFGPWLRAGVVNRFLWEVLRFGDYIVPLYVFAAGGRALLRGIYGYHPIQRMLYPMASWFVRRRYPEVIGRGR